MTSRMGQQETFVVRPRPEPATPTPSARWSSRRGSSVARPRSSPLTRPARTRVRTDDPVRSRLLAVACSATGCNPGALSIWLAGALILTARLILAGLALTRLVRRSADAPEEVARATAGRSPDTWAATAPSASSARTEVATPCLAGLFRPVLLLPEREGPRPDDLPAILAHELAHARHHDLAWNLAAHLASIAALVPPAGLADPCGPRGGLRRGERRRRGRLPRRRGVVRPDPGAAGRGRGMADPGARAGDGADVGRPAPPRCPQPAGLRDVARLEARRARAPRRRWALAAHRRFRLHARRAGHQAGGRYRAGCPARGRKIAREADAPRRRRGDRSADRGRFHRVSRSLRREGPEGDGRDRQGRPGDDRLSAGFPRSNSS